MSLKSLPCGAEKHENHAAPCDGLALNPQLCNVNNHFHHISENIIVNVCLRTLPVIVNHFHRAGLSDV